MMANLLDSCTPLSQKLLTKRNTGDPGVLSPVCAQHGAWRESAI